MNEWVPLGELISIQRGTTYKSQLLGQPGPVLLGLASIGRHGGFRSDSLKTYGGDSPSNLLVQQGELFASLKDVTQTADLLGSVARVPKAGPIGRLTQDTVRLDVVSDRILPAYLYWYLRTPTYRAYCRSHATGTTTLGLARTDFLGFPVWVPPVATQERISGVLEDVESLIGVTRRTVADARELRSALIGQAISEATEARPLTELARFVNGKNFTKDASGTGRPVIRTPEVRRGPVEGTILSDASPEQDHVASAGDILFVWSGSLMVERWMFEDGLVNQHIFKVIPEAIPDWLAFGLVEHQMTWFRGLAADKATTMGHIQRAHLDAPVPMPDQTAIFLLERIVRPLWELELDCQLEMRRLGSIRDDLLPLLMSGQVEVRRGAA